MIASDLKRFSIFAVLLAGLAVGFPGRSAATINLAPLRPGDYFVPVTLSRGQSVRINVADLGSHTSVAPRFAGKVLVMFVNQNGTILNGKGRGKIVTLRAGHAATVRFAANRHSGAPAAVKRAWKNPLIVRGVVLPLTGLPSAIQSSMEIVDTSGRTTQALGPVEKFIQNPQPPPVG
jgi:hypothetical protein